MKSLISKPYNQIISAVKLASVHYSTSVLDGAIVCSLQEFHENKIIAKTDETTMGKEAIIEIVNPV